MSSGSEVVRGGLLPDLLHHDLALLARRADSSLERALRGGEAGARTEAVLDRAAVALLAGDSMRAMRSLASLRADDAGMLGRGTAYASWAREQHANTYPGGDAADGMEVMLQRLLHPDAADPPAAASHDEGATDDRRLVTDVIMHQAVTRTILRHRAGRGETDEASAVLAQRLPAVRNAGGACTEPGTWQPYRERAAAELLHAAGRREDALTSLHAAARAFERVGELAGLATCYLLRGDWLAAPFSHPDMLDMAPQTSPAESSTLPWTTEARELDLAAVDAEAAAADYEVAATLFEEAGARRGAAAVLLRRGYLAFLADDFQVAAGHAERAGAVFAAAGDSYGAHLAATHELIARVGAGERAVSAEPAAHVGAWGAGDGSYSLAYGLGILLSRAGRHWLLRRGDYERALSCYRLAETLFHALGAEEHRGQCIVDGGRVHQAVGDHRTALVAYEEALEIYLADAARRPALAVLARRRALLLANAVYGLYQGLMDPDNMARTAERLGAVASELAGDPAGGGGDAGVEVEDRALAELVHSSLAQAQVLVPLYRAIHAREEGRTADSERDFSSALRAAQGQRHDSRHLLEAVVLGSWRRQGEAIAAYDRYLEAGGANSGLAGELADLVAAAGPEGREEMAKQVARTHEQAAGFFLRARAYERSDEHFRALEALSGPRWWEATEPPWEGLSDRAATFEGLGDLDRARRLHDDAISLYEQRRSLLGGDALRTAIAGQAGVEFLYFRAARNAAKASEQAHEDGDGERAHLLATAAFSYAERGRARSLLDLMGRSAELAGAAAPESAGIQQWQAATARLSVLRGLLVTELAGRTPDPAAVGALRGRIADAERALLVQEADLERSDPGFHAAVRPATRVPELEEVAARLPDNSRLIAYEFLEQDLLAWVIAPRGLVRMHRALIEASELSARLRGFANACARGHEEPETGEELAATLFGPLADAVRGVDHLVIVPFGALHGVPFHALPWDGAPLAASYAFSYLPSAGAATLLEPLGRGLPDRALAVGDPARMADREVGGGSARPLPSLPAAAAEAAFVADLFPRGTLLLGADATEEAVRARIGEEPILHFATHASTDEQAPLLSSILLADGEALTVYELAGLRLRAELVVLSACSTARGQRTSGDDVLGLTRGLLAAGARSALVSLWPVNDVSTALLMAELYRRLQAGDRPAQALRRAQAYLRDLSGDAARRAAEELRAHLPATAATSAAWRDLGEAAGRPASACYDDPLYWAPFIFVGL